MSLASKAKSGRRLAFKLTRKRVIAVVLLALGAFIFIESGRLDSELVTTLTFEPRPTGERPAVADMPVQTSSYLLVIGLLFIVSGALNLYDFQLARWRRISLALLALCGALFIPTVIIAAAAGNDTNLTTIVAESLRLATPLAITLMNQEPFLQHSQHLLILQQLPENPEAVDHHRIGRIVHHEPGSIHAGHRFASGHWKVLPDSH